MKPDFYFSDEGSFILLIPASHKARPWVRKHIDLSEWQDPTKFAVEVRYFEDLVEGVISDGLTISQR